MTHYHSLSIMFNLRTFNHFITIFFPSKRKFLAKILAKTLKANTTAIKSFSKNLSFEVDSKTIDPAIPV